MKCLFQKGLTQIFSSAREKRTRIPNLCSTKERGEVVTIIFLLSQYTNIGCGMAFLKISEELDVSNFEI